MKSPTMVRNKWFSMSLIVFLIILTQTICLAEEPEYQAVTTSSSISVKRLPLILLPLTRDDIAAEVDAWVKLLKDKTTKKINAKITVIEAGKEATEAQQKAWEETADDVASTSAKFRIVLKAWKNKGGDAEAISAYRQYLNAMQIESLKTTRAEAVLVVAKKWIFSKDGGGKFAIRLAAAAVIFLGLFFIAKLVSKFVNKATLKVTGMSQLLRDFLVKSSKIITLTIGILIVLGILGLDMGPLIALIGGASFIIAFAMQSTLSNFASGLLVMVYKPFDVGDLVTLSGESREQSSL